MDSVLDLARRSLGLLENILRYVLRMRWRRLRRHHVLPFDTREAYVDFTPSRTTAIIIHAMPSHTSHRSNTTTSNLHLHREG